MSSRSPVNLKLFVNMGSKVSMFNQLANQHQEQQLENPFSGWEGASTRRKLSKEDADYGKPIAGSRTEERGRKAAAEVRAELRELCDVIFDCGMKQKDGTAVITFNRLFTVYNVISDKCVGLLMRARKHGLLEFEGEMLFQRRDDHVLISLLKPINTIRHQFGAPPIKDGGLVLEDVLPSTSPFISPAPSPRSVSPSDAGPPSPLRKDDDPFKPMKTETDLENAEKLTIEPLRIELENACKDTCSAGVKETITEHEKKNVDNRPIGHNGVSVPATVEIRIEDVDSVANIADIEATENDDVCSDKKMAGVEPESIVEIRIEDVDSVANVADTKATENDDVCAGNKMTEIEPESIVDITIKDVNTTANVVTASENDVVCADNKTTEVEPESVFETRIEYVDSIANVDDDAFTSCKTTKNESEPTSESTVECINLIDRVIDAEVTDNEAVCADSRMKKLECNDQIKGGVEVLNEGAADSVIPSLNCAEEINDVYASIKDEPKSSSVSSDKAQQSVPENVIQNETENLNISDPSPRESQVNPHNIELSSTSDRPQESNRISTEAENDLDEDTGDATPELG